MDKIIYKKLRCVLMSMKRRCNNLNYEHYHRYGGRGIKICDRWTDTTRVSMGGKGNNPSQGFLNFVEDMGPSWFDGATIDRIDNDGDYTPENCQWLSRNENSRKAQKGLKRSDEARRKMSEAKQGRTLSEEHCRKVSESLTGRTLSDETRRKISEAHKGRTLSEEHCRKVSESLTGRTLSDETRRKIGESQKGRKHSDEARRKISEARKKRKCKPHSEETRRKISESLKGRSFSDEALRKMSKAQKGHTVSEETRRKISEARKRYLENKKNENVSRVP